MTDRRKDAIWQHFSQAAAKAGSKMSTRPKCKKCPKEIVPLVVRMRKHLNDDCKKHPSLTLELNSNSGTNAIDIDTNSTSESDCSVKNVDSGSSNQMVYNSSNTRTKTTSTTVTSSGSTGSSRPKSELLNSFVTRTTAAEKQKFDLQVARLIYGTNCAFRTVEHPEFKKLVMLHPGYQPPNRQKIGNELLCTIYESVHAQRKKELIDKNVCMSIDGWSNVRNDSIVCVSVTEIQDGKVYLIDTIDTQDKSHTAEYLLSLLVESIRRCHNTFNCTVRSIVTDNAANMRNMRGELAKSEEIGLADKLTYGCSAHIFNLLAKDIEVPSVKEHVKKIIKYFRNVHFAAESYLENWHILSKICSEHRAAIDKDISTKVFDINLKVNAQDYLQKLKQIAIALDKVQSDNCTISECTEIWLDLLIFSKENFTDTDIEFCFKRFEMAITPAHYLANLLDHRFKGNKLSQEQREQALEYASTYYPETMPFIVTYQAEASPFKPYLFTTDSLKKSYTPNLVECLKE
ncbi:hypothetical protein NQ315_003253 [Exocentrus adspersus]|uniref:BED-type domain-containing protein n=1 Tax=Exocentrus adspersus TaxID=1586481 RepID=A0AAV8VD97_9CUCU|nr:hypothetical protein NQ315_003253 [Exocentrus adspersus]